MKRKKFGKFLSGALVVGVALSQGQVYNVLAQSPFSTDPLDNPQFNANTDVNINPKKILNLTPEQREAIKNLDKFNGTGLQLSEDIDLYSSKTVSVIVEFKNKPQKVAVLEAAVDGQSLSAEKAKNNVESDHATFKKVLKSTFKDDAKGSYKVKRQYKNAFNGVALQVPANKIPELVKSTAVKAIYSDTTVKLDEPVQETTSTEAKGQGMAAERSFLKINELHKEGFTGKGIKVAVLDTGIDYNHPDLKAAFKGGYDFINNDNDPMETTYEDWVKAGKPGGVNGAASYVTEHGTHVSGTIAGQGTADSDYATTGIAPDSELYVYRVLGPGGSGQAEGIIAAIDKAVADGMDVMNLSLGANYNDPMAAESIAINNAVLNGVTAVVAAGNSGDKMYTLGFPGAAALALTVGASDVPMNFPTMKGHNDNLESDMRLLAKGYSDDISSLISKTYQIVNIEGVGQATDYKSDVTGKLVLVQRGTTDINDKILQAKLKGAAAILIYNNVDGYMPFYLAEGVDFIPSFNLTMADGLALKQQIANGKTEFTFSDLGAITTKGDELAAFSSRGPSRMNYDIKPEVTAPGVSVLSTVPGFIHNPANPADFKYAYDRMSGTSMATPFTSGVAALLLQAQPNLQPEDVKAILMNTADPLSKTYSVFEQGAGRLDPYQAIHSSIEIKVKDKTPMIVNGREKQIKEITGALSFGNVYSTGLDATESRSVTFENHSDKSKTFDVSVVFQTNVRGSNDAEKNGVTVVTDKSIKINAQSKVTKNVTISIPDSAEKGIYEGYVIYTNHNDKSETYRVPFGAHYVEKGFKDFTLSRQSLSNDRNNIGSPLTSPYLTASFSLKSHMKSIDVVLTDAASGKDLGITNWFDGMNYNENQQYTFVPFMGYYYPFTNESHTMIRDKAVLPKEGRYKLKLVGYNDAGETSVISQDLFIDNTMPTNFDVHVDGEKADNPFVEYKEGQKTLPFTATIHDATIDTMKSAGFNVNQSKNTIAAAYGGMFLTDTVDLDANGNAKDEILMNPADPAFNIWFIGGDQASNTYGQKQYFFVKDTTPYVYGQPNVKTRLNRVNTHAGDTLTITLSANNVNKIKQANYNFTTDTLDTTIESIKINPAAQALGGQLNTTTTALTGTKVKSDVNVTFDGSKEVTGDVPMVDVTIKIQDNHNIKSWSSFEFVNTTITSVDNVVTNPFTYIAPIVIFQDFSAVKGVVRAEAFLKNGGTDLSKDYSKAGGILTVQDRTGKTYTGTVAKNGQFLVNGLPLTRDDLTFVQDIPGHFTTYNKFTNAFSTMDGNMYGILKTLGTETVDTAVAGDVNKDNVIDIMDALAIQTYWGTNKRSADINYDGTVDAKDIAFVEKNFKMQNPTVINAPKPKTTFKGATLESILTQLGLND
ncbi:S8 family serine peptidase [Bacillus sp. AFS055030]|uniref:S8 family serine peptidase n=1 Tax=Bacillus sp. AFS055030 TaxID=2033507 RepID=UPI0015D4B01F|nr:S8 family serine peptidase [Bacillus sp. AFS055030]